MITFSVALLEAAKNKSAKDGRIQLDAQEVTIGGQSYPISGSASTQNIEHALEGPKIRDEM